MGGTFHENVKNLLNEEHSGFSGWTHFLIAVCFFFLLWLTPIAIAQEYVHQISTSALFGLMVFLVVGGASLAPDLDSSPLQEGGSTAVYQLGFLGQLLSLGCVVISGVVWNVAHTKYDKKPPSQHRMLFHAPIIPIILFLFNQMSYPNSSDSIQSCGFMQSGGASAIWVMGGICVYLGSSMFFYKLLGVFHRQSMTQIFNLVLMFAFLFIGYSMPFSRLKLIGTAICLGYMFHILGDLVTKGSAPILFPIPFFNKTSKGLKMILWWKPYPFDGKFHIETGGAVNIILNFVLVGVDLLLFYVIFW